MKDLHTVPAETRKTALVEFRKIKDQSTQIIAELEKSLGVTSRTLSKSATNRPDDFDFSKAMKAARDARGYRGAEDEQAASPSAFSNTTSVGDGPLDQSGGLRKAVNR